MSQSIFSYYYDPHIYIDTYEAPNTINFRVHLSVRNQSLQTLWFRLSQPHEDITPSYINLGSVGAGSTATLTPTFSVPKPSQDVTYSGNWKIEAFTDSNYSNKVTEATKFTEVRLCDLSQWDQILFTTFDNGTSQGWTMAAYVGIRGDWSVYPGYSIGYHMYPGISVSITSQFYRDVNIPIASMVLMSFYFVQWNNNPSANYTRLYIKVDDTTIFDYRRSIYDSTYGPYRICVNLTPYQGGTRRINFLIDGRCSSNTQLKWWIDNIRIAYKTY
ncbi:MAG: hypothetical protein QXW71_05235 [Thermoplasmata archaeon]